MSVSITSSLRVALVSGTGVTFDAPLMPSITTDDIYSAENASETLTDVLDAISSTTLLGSAIVNGKTIANTPIFTAAAGKKYIPTSIIFALTAITGSGAGPTVSIGFTATDYNDYIDASALTISTVGNVAQFTDFSAAENYAYLTEGQQVFARVSVASTFTTYSLEAFVFGFSFV